MSRRTLFGLLGRAAEWKEKNMPRPSIRRVRVLAVSMLIAATAAVLPIPSAGAAAPGLSDRSRLTVHNGGMTVTQNGTVIENLEIRGTLRIEASNVVVRNVWVYTSSFWTVFVTGGSALFENVEIGHPDHAGQRGIGGSNVTVRLADIHHVEDGIKIGSNSVYDTLYIHDLDSPNGAPHSDAIQNDGGASNAVIRNSTLDAMNASGSAGNAAIIIKSDLGRIDNIRVENNYLNGGNYTFYSVAGSNGNPTNISLINNRFGRGYRYGILSITGSVTQQGNVWADNGQPINGQQGTPPPTTTPVTTAPPTTTAPRPTTTAAPPPTTTAPRPTTTAPRPTTTAPRPTTTAPPATTAPRPTTTAAPPTTAPRPTTTAPRPTTTAAPRPTTTAARPTTTAAARPTTTAARPTTTAAARPTTTAAPASTAPRPNTTAGPVAAAAPTTAAPVLTGIPAATVPQATAPVATTYDASPATTIRFGTSALPSPAPEPTTATAVAQASATGGKIEPPGASFGSPSINPGTITPAALSSPQAREGGIVQRGFVSTVARMMTSDPLIEAGLVTMAFATLAFASRSVLLAMQRQRY